MAVSSVSPRMLEVVGSYLQMAMGSAGGSGTSEVITIPQFTQVEAVLVGGNTSVTPPYVATISGNTFTVTFASNDRFTWIAMGKAKV